MVLLILKFHTQIILYSNKYHVACNSLWLKCIRLRFVFSCLWLVCSLLWLVCSRLWLVCSRLWLVCSLLCLICSHLWLVWSRLWLVCSRLWLACSCLWLVCHSSVVLVMTILYNMSKFSKQHFQTQPLETSGQVRVLQI